MEGPCADWGWLFVTWPGHVTFLGTRGLKCLVQIWVWNDFRVNFWVLLSARNTLMWFVTKFDVAITLSKYGFKSDGRISVSGILPMVVSLFSLYANTNEYPLQNIWCFSNDNKCGTLEELYLFVHLFFICVSGFVVRDPRYFLLQMIVLYCSAS